MSPRKCKSRPLFSTDERAVSVMVGALLLVGIFVATMITVRVAYVPSWEEDREASTSRSVQREFSTLKAELDRLATNGSSLPIAHQITLTERTDSIFRLPSIPSTLEYIDANRIFRVSASTINLLNENGTDYTRLNETFAPIPDGTGTEILDIGTLLSLRLRIDQVQSGNSYNNSEVIVQLRDADGEAAGRFRVWLDDSEGGYKLVHETYDRWGTLLHSEATSHVDGVKVAPFYVDVHESRYRFNEVLRSASGPVDINLTHSFPAGTADHTITYTQTGTGGTIIRTTGGFADTSFQKNFVGGNLRYDAYNRYFVENGWRLEHGGLILVQSDGALMHTGPRFSIGIVRDDILRVSLVLPQPTGDGTSIAGSGSTTLTTGVEDQYKLVAEAPQFTFNLTTEYPDVWVSHWNATLTDAGLTDQGSSASFAITSGSNWVQLRLIGLGASGQNDLYLELYHASISFTIEG